MPKQYFWPSTLILFGAIISGTLLGLVPMDLIIVWPILMLIIGLGGLVTADRDEWMTPEEKGNQRSKKK